MRLLVLGGSWFIGRAVIADAKWRGWEVTAFNRGRSGTTPGDVRMIYGYWERAEDVAYLAPSKRSRKRLSISGSATRGSTLPVSTTPLSAAPEARRGSGGRWVTVPTAGFFPGTAVTGREAYRVSPFAGSAPSRVQRCCVRVSRR